MVRILLTGATGYVGGEALHSLYNATTIRPQITALVRNAQKGAEVAKQYPEVKVVHGDLDALDLIREESRKADAVFHLASTKHEPSSQAIANGLGDAGREKPGYWIQMSGASMFSGPDIKDQTYGEARPEVYNDVRDASTISSIIKNNPARVVDNLVLAQDPAKVRTALIIGPLIYGQGRGPGNQRSVQVPEIARITLQTGAGFRVGAGKNAWSNVHIQDLGAFFKAVLEAIASDKADCWNEQGIYVVENGSAAFGEIGQEVAREAHRQGFIRSPEVTRVMTTNEANAAMPHGAVLWGTNAVGIAERAKSGLGWNPSWTGPDATIAETVQEEARWLGLA